VLSRSGSETSMV